MAISVTYPGVYVQELPSSVHTIVGVPTSVAAFVGEAPRGPVDVAKQVDSWPAYVRMYGGVDNAFPMSWAVFLFFNNGGSVAQIVRATGGTDAKKGVAAQYDLTQGYEIEAASPGPWGDHLSLLVDHDNVPNGQFNLSVEEIGPDGFPVASERFTFLDDESVGEQLKRSNLVRLAEGATPAANAVPPVTQVPAFGALGVKVGKPGKPPVVTADDVVGAGAQGRSGGIFALTKVDIFNMLCLPTAPDKTYSRADLSKALALCRLQRAVLIVDPPKDWAAPADVDFAAIARSEPVQASRDASYAATYYPNLVVTDTQGKKVTGRPLRSRGRRVGRHRRVAAECGRRRREPRRSVLGDHRPRDAGRRCQERRTEPPGRQRPAGQAGIRASRLGRSDSRRQGLRGGPVEIPAGAENRAVHRGVTPRGHAVGRVRAQRRAALGLVAPQRRRVHAQLSGVRGRSREQPRRMPTWSSATRTSTPRTRSTSGSSTSWSGSLH